MLSTFFEIRKRVPRLRRRPYREFCDPNEAAKLGWGEDWAAWAGLKTLQLNALYLWILRALPTFGISDQTSLTALDLGSKDFAYAPALSLWLRERFPQSVGSLRGLEIDPYQLYFDFYRRFDVATYYAARASEQTGLTVSYEAADWLRAPVLKTPQIIFCLFPFLYDDLHRGAGIPQKHFDPFQFYLKMASSRPEAIVFFHQGSEEKRTSLDLIDQALKRGHIVYQNQIQQNPFLPRQHTIEVLLWLKEP